MIEIVIVLIIWMWGITPLWLNIVVSGLLFIRFSWRMFLTVRKFFEWINEADEKYVEETNKDIRKDNKGV